MFARKVKKFSSQEKTILDDEVRRIIANPSIGQEKRGTLKGIFIHKFKIHTNQFLLAYRCDPKALVPCQAITAGSCLLFYYSSALLIHLYSSAICNHQCLE